MPIKIFPLLIGLVMVLTSCATGQYANRMTTPQGTPAVSATDMGMRYLLGRGVPKDEEKAFAYFSQGARDDDPFAQNELAYLYASGKGTQKNELKAFSFYEKAATHGLASAQYNLGFMYLHGMGTEINRVLARKWFEKSAAHGFEPAKIALTRL